jgi:hypothetical protein
VAIVAVSAMLLTFASPALAATDITEVRIEQIHAKSPDLRVNLFVNNYTGEITKDDISAKLGGEDLEVTGVMRESGNKNDPARTLEWFLLVDVSGSISVNDSDAPDIIKKALKDFRDKINTNDMLDTITLIPFGDGVNEYYFNSEEDEAKREDKIDGLKFTDDETALYEAVSTAVTRADQNKDDITKRNIGVIITDGKNEDFTGTKADKEKALKQLRAGDMPLYAFALSDGNVSALKKLTDAGSADIALDSAGGGTTASGGDLFTVKAKELGKELTGFADDMLGSYVVTLKKGDNAPGGAVQDLTMTIRAGDSTLNATVGISALSSTPDETAPQVVGIRRIPDENGIRIEFSKLLNEISATDKNAYTIKDEKGAEVQTKGNPKYYTAESEAGEKVSYVEIRLGKELYSGEYTVSFHGITDNSNERNSLADKEKNFTYEGRSGFMHVLDVVFGQFWWAVALLILAVIALILLLYIRKRGGIVRVDGKIGFGDMVEFKQRFGLPQTGSVSLIVTDSTGRSQNIDIDINKSFFVGRSNINNLSFADDKLSRQHFVIEVDRDAYFITDLATTNGTYLNGIPLKGRYEIKNNDVITAGREKIVFREKTGKGA